MWHRMIIDEGHEVIGDYVYSGMCTFAPYVCCMLWCISMCILSICVCGAVCGLRLFYVFCSVLLLFLCLALSCLLFVITCISSPFLLLIPAFLLPSLVALIRRFYAHNYWYVTGTPFPSSDICDAVIRYLRFPELTEFNK